MKENKEIIVEELKKYGFKLGSFNSKLNKLNKSNLSRVIEGVRLGDATDVDVFINRALHVVEIFVVDDEMDFDILSKEEYVSRYGDERWEN